MNPEWLRSHPDDSDLIRSGSERGRSRANPSGVALDASGVIPITSGMAPDPFG